MTRCTLAADSLDALRKCLSVRPYKGENDSQIGASAQLQSEFRDSSLTKNILCSFFELGQSLQKGLVEQRLGQVKAEIEKMGQKKERQSLDRSHFEKFEFDEWEQRLW